MFLLIIFLLSLCTGVLEARRSVFRKPDAQMPIIRATLQNNPIVQYTRSDWYLQFQPIFHEEHFFSHLLPEYAIPLSSETNSIAFGWQLSELLQKFYLEILEGKKEFTDFIVLQKKNFNRKKCCGLIVVKFKEYPFVAKLFIETPRTLLNPYCKGFENIVFDKMGRGMSRHIAGFTRIPNLERAKAIIASNPKWRDVVVFPRKWYWFPTGASWITLSGKNICTIGDEFSCTIPGAYAIVADEVTRAQELIISAADRRALIMRFCNDMGQIIDPHLENYVLKEKNGATQLYVMDTEDFLLLLGLPEALEFANHAEWLFHLAGKALSDLYFYSKKDHLEARISKPTQSTAT
jgi:hypothetical protein